MVVEILPVVGVLPPAAMSVLKRSRVTAPTIPRSVRGRFMMYLSWNVVSAAFVAGPKVVDSLPDEPGPVSATTTPWVFKNCWR